ncbi:EAL domain-containing protein [Litorilituus sediminis]|uniref:EAL domain-containing protein n=1 Tax=Litorilituus sediminis TaxID=718192 RepID=A0A4P6P4F0_9GAMM|nr:EAL domain-containing protein [Litorilituus sediminis]QBG34959.1 EAL domain-containing protein [Litorilituus sediminis]
MYKFSKLLFKNSLIAALFFLVFCFAVLFFVKNDLSEQSNQHQYAILALSEQLAQSSSANDSSVNKEIAKSLAILLKKSNQYLLLSIRDNTGSLYNSQKKPSSYLSFIFPEKQSVRLNGLAFTLEYQLDLSKQTGLVNNILIALFILAITFTVLASVLNYRLQSKVLKAISSQIKHDLDEINNPEGDSFGKSKKTNGLDIPELKEGIAEIKALMSEQLKNSTSLEMEAYVDHLTGLENRNRFVQFYEEQITQESPINFGVLLITRCSELQTINQVHGYHEGDTYITNVADLIKAAISKHPRGKLFRLNSSDFATILPNEKIKQAEVYAQELTQEFNQYQQAEDLDSVAFTGLVFFDKTKPLGELLALADTGVSVAQTKSNNSWYSLKDTDIISSNVTNTGNQNWRQEIDSVIEGQRIALLLQPIQPSGRNNKVYSEVLARFLNSNDEMLPTASFIAMAEKLDKIVAVDKLIIDSAINEIVNKNMLENSFGINISARSINDEHFMIWLERKLLREPAAASRLVFEITEFGLQQNIKTGKRLVEMLHRVGARVTVERFGVGLTSFKFFRDLTPDYIKMDSSYTRDIDDDKNNQYFLRLMVDLAHRLGINVLAESVETQEEKHTLEKLFIDGCQGFYVGKPAPL